MTSIIVLYWVAGSCGDLLSSLLLTDSNLKASVHTPVLINSGRVQFQSNEEVLSIFPKQNLKHWYTRLWDNDLDKLNSLTYKFLLQTVSESQFLFLKQKLSNAIFIAVNYEENLFPYVAKSFCKKVLDYPNYLTKDDVGLNFLNSVAKDENERKFFISLGLEKKLGIWYLEKLVNNSLEYPPKKSIHQADIVIELDELLNINYFNSIIEQLNKTCCIEYDSAYKFYLSWLNLQDQLYTSPGSKKYQKQLGYNKTFKLLNSTTIDTTSDFNKLFLNFSS